jgi:hypothetical protein
MAQAASHRPLTAETRVSSGVSTCGIYGGHSGTGAGVPRSSWGFPCQYHSTVALRIHIDIWGMKNR